MALHVTPLPAVSNATTCSGDSVCVCVCVLVCVCVCVCVLPWSIQLVHVLKLHMLPSEVIQPDHVLTIY